MDTDKKGKQRNMKDIARLSTVGDEASRLKKMEVFHQLVRSWSMKEEEFTPFSDWKVVYEYLIDPIPLSDNFSSVFPEVESLLNTLV